MKEPRDWTEKDVLGLPFGEYDWFEAKGRKDLDFTLPGIQLERIRSNLSVSLSAFANTGGGSIIFGLKDPRRTTQWEIDEGGIPLDLKGSTREWLEDVIPHLVEYPLSSFNVYCLTRKADNSQIAEGQGLFIVQAPDSEQVPHQASDNKYYARVSGKSRPIGHRLVADIFGRRQYPLIELEFEIHMRASYETPTDPMGIPRHTN